MKEYLNSSIKKTMLISKVETPNNNDTNNCENFPDKQLQLRLGSVRLSREKEYDSYRKEHKDNERFPNREKKNFRSSDPRKLLGDKRASTSHQDQRYIKNQGT